jgi:hypothetical protein
VDAQHEGTASSVAQGRDRSRPWIATSTGGRMMIDFRRMGLDLAALGLFAAVIFAGLSLIMCVVPPGR